MAIPVAKSMIIGTFLKESIGINRKESIKADTCAICQKEATINNIEAELSEIRLELIKTETVPEANTVKPTKIDFTNMPEGTLVECRDNSYYESMPKLFGKINPGYVHAYVMLDGSIFKQIRLNTSPIYAWFGGECPLPDNVMVKVWFKDWTRDTCQYPVQGIRWKHIDSIGDVIAYQIQESEWQD